MALSKQGKLDVATLVNRIYCAGQLQAESKAEGKPEMVQYWLVYRCRAELELFERFGVELPGLDTVRRIIADADAAE